MLPLKQPTPMSRQAEREQEARLEGHQEVAERHQAGADDDGLRAAEQAVGQQAAEQRRQVDEAGVEAEHGRGELLRRAAGR